MRLRGSKAGPLFVWKDGSPLQKPQFNLTQAKLPAKNCWTQFSNWCSYYCCICWSRGLNNSNTRALKEFIIFSIYQVGTKTSGSCFIHISRVCALNSCVQNIYDNCMLVYIECNVCISQFNYKSLKFKTFASMDGGRWAVLLICRDKLLTS